MTAKRYVLLIEDEKFQAVLFSKIIEDELSEFGYEVVTLDNGRDALKFFSGEKILKIDQNEVGLVLLDLAIHDISGLQILEKIEVKIPVAVLSANEDKKTREDALSMGATDYFVKGKNLEELNRLREFIIRVMK
ncbi:MAG: response regulator [Proteobacteria bacterium]|nr:response regulator [Pseudomonadota bacterium]